MEISHLEATLTAHAWLVTSWAANGQLLDRQPMDLIRAKDGWVYVMRIVPKDELFIMIERPDMMDENLTVDLPTWYLHMDRIFAAVAEWAKDHTVAEIVELGQLMRIAVTPVLDGHDVLADEQLRGARLVGARRRHALPGPAVPVHGHPDGTPRSGAGARGQRRAAGC